MKNIPTEEKEKLIKKHTPKGKTGRNCLRAFFVGGLLCSLAETERRILVNFGALEKDALSAVTLSFIFLGSLLTSVGVFDKIARYAGAGILLPITGFSNAITSEAIDARSEGMVMGVGAKIFTVSGPVILYGLLFGVAYGIIYYLTGLIIPYFSP